MTFHIVRSPLLRSGCAFRFARWDALMQALQTLGMES